MKVFLGWSGEPSRSVAESLRKYLPCVLQGLQPFMSKHDIGSGARWNEELAKELENTGFGILCLTTNNLGSKWLHFEAGALAKKHVEGRVCGLLLGDLDAADVAPPLSQFQHRKFSREELRRLLGDLNDEMEGSLGAEQVDLLFGKFWADLETDYLAALEGSGEEVESHKRTERELLEEILLRTRSLEVARPRTGAVKVGVSGYVTSKAVKGGELLLRPVSYDSIAWYTLWKFPRLPLSEHVQGVLLKDLDRGKYPLIQEIDEAVDRARDAVETYAKENPEVFKFGTDYITKSLGFVDVDFRGRHGFAQRTRQAFEDHGHLVRPPQEENG